MKSYVEAFDLTGKNALITGGGTGLGFAMARCLASAGAQVILLGRREKELDAACDEIGERAHKICFDITDFDKIEEMVASVEKTFGTIDILINNAGIQIKKKSLEFTMEDFDQILNVHIKAAYQLTKAVCPYMLRTGGGSVIFISSMTGFLGISGVLPYSAAKAGILGVMRSFTEDLSCRGIRFNAIAPGWTDTPMLKYSNQDDPEREARILARTPMRRFGQPEDIGWAALYLASDAAAFVTGTCLAVDGGALIGF